MTTSIGLVGAGAMGAALGAGWRAGGSPVRTALVGRSERTRALAAAAGLAEVASIDEVVAAGIVVSIVPPGQAVTAARSIAAAAQRTGHRPLVVDLNAVAPATIARIADVLAGAGLPLVDGSISGGPPTVDRHPRVYVSGPDAATFVAVPSPWLDVVALGDELGIASALKMCTASVYKGTKALVMQAMLTAHRHGVLAEFLEDTARVWPADVPNWHTEIALAATKADRFVDEMDEIARTQAAAGLPVELFGGVAAAFRRAARTPLGHEEPERVDGSASVEDVLAELTSAAAGPPAAVLFDFSGTLFHVEPAAHALLAALGPEFVSWAPALVRLGAINGSDTPVDLPEHLAEVWAGRDLSADAHRAAYSGLSEHAGLTAAQAAAVYARGVSPEAWTPYPDTIAVLRTLHDAGVPVAVISNIGWDPRPVLARYGVDRDIAVLVLSDERGVLKPDPAIFRAACDELGVAPGSAVMVGDNPDADGGAAAIGVRFVAVEADPGRRPADALTRAVGLRP